MKKAYSYLLVLLMVFAFSAYTFAADSFYVIHIKGSATNKTSGKPLKVGDQITSSDKIKFGSVESAVVIMGAKGKFTLTPTASANNTSELVAVVQNALVPLKSNGHLSTRGGEAEKVVDLKSYLGTSKFFILGDKLSIPLDENKYPVTDKQIFIYRYIYNGAVVSKKVESQGNTLVIDKTALYTVKGEYIEPEKIENVDLYYYNTDTKSSTKIVNFIPVFLNEATVKEELNVQKSILKKQNKSSQEIQKELLAFMSDVYGRTDETTLKQWIKTTIGE